MNHEMNCSCGNENCHSVLTFRKGNVYFGEDVVTGWLHVDASNMTGQWVEFMFSPKEARSLLWWAFKNFWRK